MNFNFSAWSIRNPVPSILLFVVLVLVGIQSFRALPITQFPNIDVPVIAVSVTQSGAAPTELESQVTKLVEDAVAGINGVKHITSTMSDGVSSTGIEFRLEIPTDKALEDVKDAIAKIRGNLPGGVDEPIIQRIDVEGQAIQTYAIKAPGMTLEQLSWYVDDTVKRAVQGLKGVGRVERYGGVEREIRVDIDPAKLQALGVTAATINSQLNSTNADSGAGRSEIGGNEQAIRTLGGARTLQELKETKIALPGGRQVRLMDVASVTDSNAEPRTFSRYNGDPVVTFSIFRSKGASSTSVGDVVAAKVAELSAANQAVTFTLVDDTVYFIYGNYASAMEGLIEGAILAVIVVLIFLRDWRATLITAISLPLSAIPTFWAMDMLGFSLNLVSFLGITLATGILVDDAIVEIENIARHIRMGKTPYRAAMEAADEIGLAVIAISFTIIAVFVPVSFMGGIVGQYFKQFGMTVAVAVLFSLIVARLITPMMAAYLMRPVKHEEEKQGPLLRGYIGLLHLLNWAPTLQSLTPATSRLVKLWSIVAFGLAATITLLVASLIILLLAGISSVLTIISFAIAGLAAAPTALLWLMLFLWATSGLGKKLLLRWIAYALSASIVMVVIRFVTPWLFDVALTTEKILISTPYVFLTITAFLGFAWIIGKFVRSGIDRTIVWRDQEGNHVAAEGTIKYASPRIVSYATVAGAFGILMASTLLFPYLPTGFIPRGDDSRFVLSVELPPGAGLDKTLAITEHMAVIIRKNAEVSQVFVLGGSSPTGTTEARYASIFVNLKHRDSHLLQGILNPPIKFANKLLNLEIPSLPTAGRTKPQWDIEEEIFPQLSGLADVRWAKINPRGQREVEYNMLSSDAVALSQAVAKLEVALRKEPILRSVAAQGSLERPEIQIIPRPDEAAKVGITASQISQAVRVATIGDFGPLLAKFKAGDRLLPIRVQIPEEARTKLSEITSLKLISSTGASVPLSSVAEVKFSQGPSSIKRFDRQRQATIGADYVSSVELGDASKRIQEVADGLNLPKIVKLQESGDAEIQGEVNTEFVKAAGLGVILMLVVLVLLLGNVFQPFAILLSLPLSIGGVVIALLLTKNAFSMPVIIGMLMLIGIVAKNAIMLIDFAVERTKHGMNRLDAIVDAGRKRARPIVMTTLAMGAGMLPSAMGIGEGGSFRAPMAIAVIGGLIASTFLSLVFVPSFYIVMDDLARLTRWTFARFLGAVDDPEVIDPRILKVERQVAVVGDAVAETAGDIDGLTARMQSVETKVEEALRAATPRKIPTPKLAAE